ncbi:MAG: hypothetical protein IPH78_13210, partial [Bacteroidetes bacterium]|nr:hypothetical protein [Bacteroidota bacterium]
MDSQTSGTTQNLFSLSFPSSTVGWAVGASGAARATNNAGQSWLSQTTASLTWYSSSFFSASQGWICGSGGGMMITTNGTTWSPTITNTTNALYDMQMVSVTTGWIVGAAGTIKRTTGSGWISQSSGTTLDLRSVHFLNLNEGWVAGATGKILKTTNSGTNWTSLTSGTAQDLYGVFFTSNTQGWVVGAGGTIRTTTNGGTTWTAQTSGTTQILRSVYFVSATQGWAVGDNGVILKTTNGGTTWTTETSGTTQALNSVYMVSATSGWIAGNNGTILVYCNPPAQPGTITGATNVCVGASQTYSVAAVAGATSYTWTLPSGWTGTSTTNSITATVGPAGSGTISVRANIGGCGSAVRTLSVTSNTIPAQPGIINANSSVCSGSTQTFSVAAVAGATSYTWTLPAGWSGSSTTNSITATVGTSGGTISVTANNGPCSSTPQTRPISVITVPAQPGTISGLTPVCAGTLSSYAVTFVSGFTYNWTLPAGWSGSSTGNGITATVGTAGGTVSVSAVNGCGNSTPSTLAVTVNQTPVQPGAISGNDTVCFNTSNTYSVTAVPNATSYTWTIPGGWTGSSTSNSLSTTSGANGGAISVKANNGSCSSPTRTLAVAVRTAPLTAPGNITGATQVCSGTAQTYSVPGLANATSYTWTLPNSWTGSSTSTSISVTTSSTAGTVSVVGVNSCGSSPAS